MKKTIITTAILLATSFPAFAQTIITSFEASESLGYGVGADIGDYTDLWSTYNTSTEGSVDSGVISISDSWATNGSQSLHFPAQNVQTSDGSVVNYASTLAIDFSSFTAPLTISFDAMTNQINTNSGSNFYANIYSYDSSSQQSYEVGAVLFNYDGTLYVYDIGSSEYVSAGSFAGGTDAHIGFRINADNSISYLSEGDEIQNYTIDQSHLTGVYYLAFGADDWSTDWSVDNITVQQETANIKSSTLKDVVIYPNPANEAISITGAENNQFDKVEITDMNGRKLKNIDVKAVSTAKINIADLPAGVYMVTVSSATYSTTKKIVKI